MEQSRWIQIPEIKFLKSESEVQEFTRWKSIIIANMNGLPYWDIKKLSNGDLCGVIWPEWWFSEKDLKLFHDANIVDLGSNVLRMETASIVLARLLKNM